jgi:hypothetical protein
MKPTIYRRMAVILLLVGLGACPAWAQDFAATLTGKSGSPAHCAATFTYDDLGRQLTYRLTCDSLSGTATMVHLFASSPSLVDMMAPVNSTPIIGTASLTVAEAAALTSGNLMIEVQSSGRPQGDASGRIAAK